MGRKRRRDDGWERDKQRQKHKADPYGMTTKRQRQSKDEIQGSLHCATDDKTVRCFGRDDVCFGLGGRETGNGKGKNGDLRGSSDTT